MNDRSGSSRAPRRSTRSKSGSPRSTRSWNRPPARPCLLKVDVQGLELDVLRGAARTLESVDEALIECSFVELYEGQPLADEIVLQMLEAGLRLAGVHEVVYSADGTAVQADFLFRRD